MLSNLTPEELEKWLTLLWQIGIPLVLAIYAVLRKKKTLAEAVDGLIPAVWAVVQQELRKNGGKLPNGKTPLEYAMELISQSLKLPKKLEPTVMLKLKAYHEQMGAPSPTEAPKPWGLGMLGDALKHVPKLPKL